MQRLANEQSSYARAALSTRAIQEGCLLEPLLSSPFLLSLPFLLFLFSLSSLLLSPFCFQKPIWESVRQESSHTDGVEGAHLGSICGLWTHVKHLCCAQKPPNRSSGEANTQKPTKSNIARKRRQYQKYVWLDTLEKKTNTMLKNPLYLKIRFTICLITGVNEEA